ncbi:MAG TPA: alkaline phosphatase family protein, partial [Burkholderiales bacterium]|nr:alkaline phosphatase family protein [Burkholderiales bacterium]
MPPSPKLLFIGVCAAEGDLIAEWAAAGVLPTFRSLIERGLTGRTQSVEALFVQCNWPAFYTGTGPAKQGVHSWEQLQPGTYQFYRAYTPEHVRSTPFWDHLSLAGRRVAIFDIPHSQPSPRINGLQVCEWGAHDANYGLKTWPESLGPELLATYGDHPQRGLCDAARNADQMVAFRDGLLRGIAGKTAMTKHFLAQEPWDFFAQVFTESHCVGHQCWHLHDRNHPRFNERDFAVTGDPVKDVYVAIDRAIGEILETIEPDTRVVVLASHGMNAKYNPNFMLGDILERLGVAERKKPPPPPPLAGTRRLLDPILTRGWQMLPGAAKALLQPMRRGLRDWVVEAADQRSDLPMGLEPSAGKCFLITNNHTHGGIRVNLAGREPNGKVQPGAEYESLLAQLSRDLMEIKNVDTGKRIVNRMIRTSDLFSGELTAHFPDLMVEWSASAPVRAIHSDKIGRIEKEYTYCRTGEHNPAGMFFATGPGIAHGRMDRVVSIMDFAPTFCTLLGVHVEGLDGRPIPELLASA